MSDLGRYLVDTSAWIEALRATGDPVIRARVSELAADDRVVLCDAVRLELWNGARSARDHRVLRALEENLETVPTTAEVWARARGLARSSRRRGLTIPAMDLLIVACAAQHRCELVHHDAHFAWLDELGGEEA